MQVSDFFRVRTNTGPFFEWNDALNRSMLSERSTAYRRNVLCKVLRSVDVELRGSCPRSYSRSFRMRPNAALNSAQYRKLKSQQDLEVSDGEDEDLCPVECVKEFRTSAELSHILDVAREKNALVVVDFYRTSCGSCKYIEQGFIKLCKGAGDDEHSIIFLKHNVMDEYEEQSEVAEDLKIKVVPLFHFYKNGKLLESFPTREKSKILETIQKYLSSISKESAVGT
ncbi:hypothetical protein KP509_35G035700 [Ceratopteris richardii]|uniref:Thioredoxin domain-containing protein n=1 Tax=Ceratopteris richardii TaxID=49495 RepID=A0A8T2QGI0_CERRI|nr:hypothetical protein KP509_35G035700 [Ceratopteris richardii]